MKNIGFSSYYNRHISFKLIGGVETSGMIMDTLDSGEKLVDTWYSFIPSRSLEKWEDAKLRNDTETMKQCEQIIDIQKIVGVKDVA